MANPEIGSQTADLVGVSQQPGVREEAVVDSVYGIVPYLKLRAVFPVQLEAGERFKPRFILGLEEGVSFEDPSGLVDDLLRAGNGSTQYLTIFTRAVPVGCDSVSREVENYPPFRFNFKDVGSVLGGQVVEPDTNLLVKSHFDATGTYDLYCRLRRGDGDTSSNSLGWENITPVGRIKVSSPVKVSARPAP